MRYHVCSRLNYEQVTFGTSSRLQYPAALILWKGLKYPFAGGQTYGQYGFDWSFQKIKQAASHFTY